MAETRPKAEAKEREETPSDLDDTTHAELRLLYEESSNAVLFAKGHQWRTVGSTLVVFLVLVALGRFISSEPGFLDKLVAVIILLATSAVLMLVIYQFWQHTERRKLDAIGVRFSTTFRSVRALKSRLEADIHRYTLLVFMIFVVLLGAYVSYLGLSALSP